MNPDDYDYNAAGFDNFMSRSVDNNSQINLDSPAPPNNATAFDRTQVGGTIGDIFRTGDVGQTGDLTGDISLIGTFKIGRITLDGENDNITLTDDNNDLRLLIGRQDNGF